MKFTPEVVAALKVLRAAAENDFERHRLDVLERDLHEPPTVEIIDENHQWFNGISYSQRQNGRYSTTKQIHRIVWEYHYGAIPKGYEIHHVDGNPANNNVSNLECLTAEAHREKHKQKPRSVFNICQNCGSEFFAAIPSKFCSPVCRAAAHQKLEQNRVIKICPVCKKSFSTPRRSSHEQICCSHVCATTYMHDKRKTVNESSTRTCKNCGKEFPANESHIGQFCSESCRGLYRQKTQLEQRICPECGKTFSCYKYSKTSFCSRRCANINNGKKRRSEN